MFKYVSFTKAKNEFTVLQFRSGDEDVKVNFFDVDVVSLESADAAKIDALIAEQSPEIGCQEITYDVFKALATESSQINRIREVVASEVSKKYSYADEIALLKVDATDVKRVAYDAYVAECVAKGDALKAEIGY